MPAPLRGIRTVVDWILEDYTDKLDDQGREQLNLLANQPNQKSTKCACAAHQKLNNFIFF